MKLSIPGKQKEEPDITIVEEHEARDIPNLFDEDRLEEAFCQLENCNLKQNPLHKHPIEGCKKHTLWISDKMQEKRPTETKTCQPEPRQYFTGAQRGDDKKSMDFMSEARDRFMEDWDQAIKMESFGTGGRLIKGTKLIVDKFGCDQWVAQGAGVDLERFPLRNQIDNQEAWNIYDHYQQDYSRYRGGKITKKQQAIRDEVDQARKRIEEKEIKQGKVPFMKRTKPCDHPDWAKTSFRVQESTKAVKPLIDLINGPEWPLDPKRGAYQSKRSKSSVSTLNPPKVIRDRMESTGLSFMQKGEIQRASVKYQSYRKEMNRRIQQKRAEEKELQQERDRLKAEEEERIRINQVQKKQQDVKREKMSERISAALKAKVEQKKEETEKQVYSKKIRQERQILHSSQTIKSPLKAPMTQKKPRLQSAMAGSMNRGVTRSRQAFLTRNSSSLKGNSIEPIFKTQLLQDSQDYGSTVASTNQISIKNQLTNKSKTKINLKEFLLNDETEKHSTLMSPETTKPFAARTKIEFPTFKEMIDNAPSDRQQGVKDTITQHLRVYRPTVRVSHQKSDFLMKNYETAMQNGALQIRLNERINKCEPIHLNQQTLDITLDMDTIHQPTRLSNHSPTSVRMNINASMNSTMMAETKPMTRFGLPKRSATPMLGTRTGEAIRFESQMETIDTKKLSFEASTIYTQIQIQKEQLQRKTQIMRTCIILKLLKMLQKYLPSPFEGINNRYLDMVISKKNISESQSSSTEMADDYQDLLKDKQKTKTSEVLDHQNLGHAPTGKALKSIEKRIKAFLEIGNVQQQPRDPKVPSINLPKFTLSKEDMRKQGQPMDDPKFWLQQALKNEEKGFGRYEHANVFYRQGLRITPSELTLIYNYATNSLMLGKKEDAITWFKFGLMIKPRWVNGLAGLAVTYFEHGMCKKASETIKEAQRYFKQCEKDDEECLFIEEEINFLLAIFLKSQGDDKQAGKIYLKLQDFMKSRENQEYQDLLISVFALSISDQNRKTLMDKFSEIKQYFKLFVDENEFVKINENLVISKYTIRDAQEERAVTLKRLGNTGGYDLPLDWQNMPQVLKTILKQKCFFRRFTGQQLIDNLQDVRVKHYLKGEVVHLENRIGVILSGSVIVKNHSGQDLCKPRVLFKATEGHVIGFAQGEKCGGLTTDPLSWIITHGIQTEILWFSKPDFERLWDIQKQDTHKQIVMQTIEQNELFMQMSILSRYFLVYESMHYEVYMPGELVMSMDERSPLNDHFIQYYKDQYTPFKYIIDERRSQVHQVYRKRNTGLKMKKSGTVVKIADESDTDADENVALNVIKDIVVVSDNSDWEASSDSSSSSSEDDQQHPQTVEQLAQIIKEKQLGPYIASKFRKTKKIQSKMSKTIGKALRNKLDSKIAHMLFKKAQAKAHQIMTEDNNELNMKKKHTKHNCKNALTNKLNPLMVAQISQVKEKQALKESKEYYQKKFLDDKLRKQAQKKAKDQRNEMYTQLSHKQAKYDVVKANENPDYKNFVESQLKRHSNLKEQVKMFRKCLQKNVKKGMCSNLAAVFKEGPESPFLRQNKDEPALLDMKQYDEALVEAVSIRESLDELILESNAMCLVESGEAVVYNKQMGGMLVKLNKGQLFGESYLTRQIGFQYSGDVRSGLRPLNLYKFSYCDLDRILTFPELAVIRDAKPNSEALRIAHTCAEKKGTDLKLMKKY